MGEKIKTYKIMLIKLLKTPAGLVATAATVVTGLTAFGNGALDKISDFDLNIFKAEASEVRKSCFDKEQDLTEKIQQGVTICFENSLEKVSVEFYSVSSEGIRSNGLMDEKSFKEFINLETFDDEIEEVEKESKTSITKVDVKSVKGVSEILGKEDSSNQSNYLKNTILQKIEE